MSETFLAGIHLAGFNFAGHSQAFCDGQISPINQNHSLYLLLGTTFVDDGRTSFALPELYSRIAIHKSSGHSLGQILARGPANQTHSDHRVTSLRSGSITDAGKGQSHNNMPSFTAVVFTITLQALFPGRIVFFHSGSIYIALGMAVSNYLFFSRNYRTSLPCYPETIQRRSTDST